MAPQPLVVAVTGSSASIVLPDYLIAIKQRLEIPVTVVMTHSAERFVRAEVAGWFADVVLTSGQPDLNPIEVALSARALVVLPASGNTIASAALGLMSTPVTTMLAAAPGPVLFFPQTNPVVWHKAVMQQHVDTLRARGDMVIDPQPADGYEIWCRSVRPTLLMPDPDSTVETIEAWLAQTGRLHPDGPAADPRRSGSHVPVDLAAATVDTFRQ